MRIAKLDRNVNPSFFSDFSAAEIYGHDDNTVEIVTVNGDSRIIGDISRYPAIEFQFTPIPGEVGPEQIPLIS